MQRLEGKVQCLIVIDYEGKSDKVKTGILLNVIDDNALELYKGFEWEEEDDKWNLDKVLAKFANHCIPSKSTFKQREELWQMT